MRANRKNMENYGSNTRSERRIRNNRIRRKKEMRKNFLLTVMTICLVIAFSFSISGFRSNAKDDGNRTACKYYKSIVIGNGDTLWSIAQEYMDEEHYGSTKDYINEVQKLNALGGEEIHYGEYLIVPYYAEGDVG